MISVIVPTLNEAAHLPETLARIRSNSTRHEIIIVDGGSDDNTSAIASAAGARVVPSQQRNRACQMNLGAKDAVGNVFLFLHTDTRITNTSLAQIEHALRDERISGGGFARRFDFDSRFLRLTCALATLRCSLFGLFLGDQGIFVRRNVFEQLGGFKELRLFEDVDFSRRLARAGKSVTLKPAIVSSARRFKNSGPFLTTFHDLWLTCRYVCGWRPIPPSAVCSFPESPHRVAAQSRLASASSRAVSRTAE